MLGKKQNKTKQKKKHQSKLVLNLPHGSTQPTITITSMLKIESSRSPRLSWSVLTHVTQSELVRLFEGYIKTDILNLTYWSISKKHFDTKIFSYHIPIKSYG